MIAKSPPAKWSSKSKVSVDEKTVLYGIGGFLSLANKIKII